MSNANSNVVTMGASFQQADSFEPTPEILKAWTAVYKELRNEFGEAVYRSWLKPLSLQAYYHGTLEVSVPTRFMRDWIQSHYAARILEMSMEKNAEIKRLEIVVVQNSVPLDEEDEEILARPKANINELTADYDLSSPLDPRFTFDNFVLVKQTHWHMLRRAALLSVTRFHLTHYISMAALALVKHNLCTLLGTKFVSKTLKKWLCIFQLRSLCTSSYVRFVAKTQ